MLRIAKDHYCVACGQRLPECACPKAAPTSNERVSGKRLEELLDFFEYRYTGRESLTGEHTVALLAELQQRRADEAPHPQLRAILERIAQHAKHQPPSGLTSDHLVGYWQGRAEGICLEARAALEALPVETTAPHSGFCAVVRGGRCDCGTDALNGVSQPPPFEPIIQCDTTTARVQKLIEMDAVPSYVVRALLHERDSWRENYWMRMEQIAKESSSEEPTDQGRVNQS